MLVMNGLIEFDQICVSGSHFIVICSDANCKYSGGTEIIFCKHRASPRVFQPGKVLIF